MLATVLAAVLAGMVALVSAPAQGAAGDHRPARPCSRGLVALTFDDGPSPTVTPRMVRLLTRLEVPATFFMVGTRVESYPELARRVSEAGFTIGSHTWAHTDLTQQTDREIRSALRRTRHALVEAGVPAPTLARPPYGAIDDRVRGVLSAAGYTPVLWTIDSRDWDDGTPRQIADRVLAAVHPHRADVVLQHDGVARSPLTLRALPREISVLRKRGFCFASLGPDGRPTPPVPVATVTADRGRVVEGGRVRLTVHLDRPTTRSTTVRTTAGNVRIPSGRQAAHLWLQVPQDRTDEVAEELTTKVYGGRGVQPAMVAQALVRVVDDDPPPVARLTAAPVTASPLLTTPARVEVHLDRTSDRPVRVVVRSALGRASAVVEAGSQASTLTVTVPPGAPRDGDRQLPVRLVRVVHATAGTSGTLTVRAPDENAAQARRAAVAAIDWPAAGVPALF
ncbi:polysaccharide deacetylase family protein [Nocardioides sp.]|uniref:polysaccharide deacetylase family protein n=1 Tax=Nocardioides sp. TaxID=35761 RepID=UPI0025E0417E|nr:polysaccharide deacetylase family protein [Nocardioides sp.]